MAKALPKLYSVTAPDPSDDFSEPWEEREKRMQANLAQVQREDEDAQKKGTLVGRYFYVGVADGRAFYQVIKTTKTTATVNWCPDVAPDNWTDRIMGGGMTLPLDRVEAMVNSVAHRRKLFSKQG